VVKQEYEVSRIGIRDINDSLNSTTMLDSLLEKTGRWCRGSYAAITMINYNSLGFALLFKQMGIMAKITALLGLGFK